MTCFTRTHCRMPCWTRCGTWSRPAPAWAPPWWWARRCAPMGCCSTALSWCARGPCAAWCPRATARLPGVLREAVLRGRPRYRRPADQAARPGRRVRTRPAVRRRGPGGFPLSRRDLRGPVGAGPAEHLGRAGRRHRAGEPVGQQHRRRQGGLPPTCCASPSRRAASPPACTPPPVPASPPPTWPGTATRWSARTASGSPREPGSRPPRDWSPPISTCSGWRRTGRG